MFAILHRSETPRLLPLKFLRRAARLWLAAVVFLACFLGEIPKGVSDTAPSPRDDRPLLSAEDGFTRESLMEFDAPEPAPFAPAPAASVATGSEDSPAGRGAARRRRRLRRRQAAQTPPPVVVVQVPRHRNPVEGFVYWWNGWVIRNLHTKIGTVMLGTVGAKT